MITRWRVIGLGAALLIGAGVFAASHSETETPMVLGFLYDREMIESRNPGYAFPPIVDKVEENGLLWTMSSDEFVRPIVLEIGETELRLEPALTNVLSRLGYTTSIIALETEGHMTREEAADAAADFVELVRDLPRVIRFDGVAAEDTRQAAFEATFKELGEFHPRGLLGARKLRVFESDIVIERNGKPFRQSLDLNLTYDEKRPDTPYRMAVEMGLNAQSSRCLNELRFYFSQGPERQGNPDDPVLVEILVDWDRNQTSDEVLKPLIDKYVFEACSMDKTDF